MLNQTDPAYVSDEAMTSNNTLETSMTGSTNDAVLEFNAAGTMVGDIVDATSTTLGTTITFASAGLYHASITFVFAGAVAVTLGISFGAVGASLTGDPVIGTDGMLYAVDALGVAATNNPLFGSAFIRVTAADIAAGTAIARFHSTNSGGAVPVGITLASAQYRVQKVANLYV